MINFKVNLVGLLLILKSFGLIFTLTILIIFYSSLLIKCANIVRQNAATFRDEKSFFFKMTQGA